MGTVEQEIFILGCAGEWRGWEDSLVGLWVSSELSLVYWYSYVPAQ